MGTGSNKTLSSQQLEAVKHLSVGHTRQEAAQRCGVNIRTVFKWLAKPEFSSAVREAEDAYWQALLSGLRTQALAACRYLGSVVQGTKDGNSHKVKAAATLLNCALRLTQWVEVEELKQRLDALEGGADESRRPE